MQNDLSDRFLEFGANIIKLTTSLYKTPEGRHIGGQLRLIRKAALFSAKSPLLSDLLEENKERINIIAKSVITAKQNR